MFSSYYYNAQIIPTVCTKITVSITYDLITLKHNMIIKVFDCLLMYWHHNKVFDSSIFSRESGILFYGNTFTNMCFDFILLIYCCKALINADNIIILHTDIRNISLSYDTSDIVVVISCLATNDYIVVTTTDFARVQIRYTVSLQLPSDTGTQVNVSNPRCIY